MEPDEYRRRALIAAAASAAAVRTYFGLLPARLDAETWKRFIQFLYPSVMQSRRNIFDLTTEFYLSQRPSDAGEPPEFVERSYPVSSLEKALSRPRARIVGLEEFEAAERQLAQDQAAAIAVEHSMAAGRESVEDASQRDEAALGWVRVPSGDETCAFCTMLASRGPVFKNTQAGVAVRGLYRSKRSALFGQAGEPYHPNCDCIAEPVFDPHDWPGRDRYIEAQRLWYETTGGKTGVDALNALRRHLYAEQQAS